MARPRKRHVQQSFEFRTHGGRRKGAGRKQVNERKSQPHRSRAEIRNNQPMLITLKMSPDLRRLRRRDAYRSVRRAMWVAGARTGFRFVHVSIQSNHIHLIVEASSKFVLSRAMQGFQISTARQLNKIESKHRGETRKGAVFPDRYHAQVLSSPRQTRHALAYVLNNWRRHKEDRAPGAKTWLLDPYSSAISFTGWLERSEWPVPSKHDPLPVAHPESWLLREGWKRHGAISIYEAPGR